MWGWECLIPPPNPPRPPKPPYLPPPNPPHPPNPPYLPLSLLLTLPIPLTLPVLLTLPVSLPPAQDAESSSAGGEYVGVGSSHGPGARVAQKTLPSEETADPSRYGRQKETTVSQLITMLFVLLFSIIFQCKNFIFSHRSVIMYVCGVFLCIIMLLPSVLYCTCTLSNN